MTDPRSMVSAGHERLHTLSGDVLRTAPDDVLQALVDEAARRLQVPTSLVSLVLDTIQFFRAHHGLPPELAGVRATSRETSLAAAVIRGGAPIAVSDIYVDDRLPSDFAERYGLHAYLGMPLTIGGQVSGALEVLDHRVRQWTAAEQAVLATVAERVASRLDTLAARRPATGPVEPLVEALREGMVPLQVAVIEARVAALELEVLTTLSEAADIDLRPALPTLDRVRARLDRATLATCRIVDDYGRYRRDMQELQPSVPLLDIADAADAVARPLTEQVGGVRWRLPDRPCPVAIAPLVGIALISTALITLVGALLARMARSPIEARTEVDGDIVRIIFGSEAMQRQDGLTVAGALSQLGIEQDSPRLELTGQDFCIMLPVHG